MKPMLVVAFLLLITSGSIAQEIDDDLNSFLLDNCLACHDQSTETRLDLTDLNFNLEDPQVFRSWVTVFDRVERGEMPPASEARPVEHTRLAILSQLEKELTRFNLQQQEKFGRVPARRLSRKEYENTLHDLLGIGGEISKHLPPENASGSFDTIAASQEMSSVHVQSLLRAADLALDEAIQLGPKPQMAPRELDYFNSPYFNMWIDRPVRQGGGTVFKTDQDVVTFRGESFVLRSDANGVSPPIAGRYRVTITAAPHQQRSSITVSLKRQNDAQGDSGLIAAWDLDGPDYREVETITYLRPDDFIYVSADELEPAPDGKVIYGSQPASEFGGEGVKIRKVIVEGPLEKTWPPERTQRLFPGITWKDKQDTNGEPQARLGYSPVLTASAQDHVRSTIRSLAPRAFRREVSEEEVNHFVELASSAIEADRSFIESARIPLRAMLVSPQLLFLTGEPGLLDDTDLASRLSYFLWRSSPDEVLSELALQRELSKSETLAAQVNRMIDDSKFDRFVEDFLDQWLELEQIDATTPDVYLYPEYDDVLRMAMLAETRAFFKHLIDENLSVRNLIDSDFTFLNRRLAEHYRIDGVEGETIRKVELDSASVRGGILTQASIAKVTANGTTTTPVKRGNFVLTNLLGLPVGTPPPGVGSIEPDTRGATTIRETLEKHQEIESCAACHRHIDPPGFAMECFDPVGIFRERYRNSKGVQREVSVGLRFLHKDYELGLHVDSSGATSEGFQFEGIRDYKAHLEGSTEQVARNLVSQLVAFSTGGEVEFADRQEIEKILDATREEGFPIRTLFHQVIASRMFRNR